jgi:hypothetical protein
MIFLGKCVRCAPSLCAAKWSNKETDIIDACINNTVIFLQIETTFNIDTYKEVGQITFFCNYNECTNIITVLQVQANIKEYYDLSLLRKTLGFGNKSVEMTMTTTQPSTSASSTDVKSYCSTWRSQNTMLIVIFGTLVVLLATHCFGLY